MIPLTDDDGNVKAIISVQRFMKELSFGKKQFFLWIGIATLILVLISFGVAYKKLKKQNEE